MLKLDEWHARFHQQSTWTANTRRYLFNQAGISRSSLVLEVGCGTGAILEDEILPPQTHGIDIDYARVNLARHNSPDLPLVCGDAYRLPYTNHSFDIVFSHYLFLWLSQPEIAMREMVRVTRPSGVVIAIAEPDYGGRIDYPDRLEKIGKLQTDSIRMQGADTMMGRKMAAIFSYAGLEYIETGVLQGHWSQAPSRKDWDLEWKMIENDLSECQQFNKIKTLKDYDWNSWQNQSRILYIPTFYAIGKCPNNH
jgi:ubiquinone/menaquinone biosynthesis C-methylase UbiE